MHFLFYIADRSNKVAEFSYQSMINNAGFSGTDASVLEMAHFLVNKYGQQVTIMIDANIDAYVSDGVTIISQSNILNYDFSNVDFFSPCFFCNTMITMYLIDLLPKTCIFAYWVHSFHTVLDNAGLKFAASKFINKIYICPSKFVESFYIDSNRTIVIPNGINPGIFDGKHAKHAKNGNFVFHPTFDRGGMVAAKVFKMFKDKYGYGTLHFASYKNNDMNEDIDAIFHGSLSKMELRNLLNSCDYFIYPLSYPLAFGTHHDTYACVVHEAMACGVIVISWNVACLQDVYKDNIILVDPIPYPGYSPFSMHSANPNLASDNGVCALFDKIVYLENNPDIKRDIRERAKKWALDHDQTWESQADKLMQSMLSINSMHICVAKYNGNIDWLKPYKNHVYLYNKSGKSEKDIFKNETMVNNVGLDGYCHLRYIIEHYDKLPDVTVFTQDCVDDHCYDQDTFIEYLANHPFTRETGTSPNICTWPVDVLTFKIVNDIEGTSTFSSKTMKEFWSNHLNDTNYQSYLVFKWYKNMIFAATREAIQKRPKTYYINLLKKEAIAESVKPLSLHYLERAWWFILHPEWESAEYMKKMAKSYAKHVKNIGFNIFDDIYDSKGVKDYNLMISY